MLAERVGKSDDGTGDSPCTLQVPQTSRQILMRRLIVVGLCLVNNAVNKDQGKPKHQYPYRDPRQDEERASSLQHRTLPCALTGRRTRMLDQPGRL